MNNIIITINILNIYPPLGGELTKLSKKIIAVFLCIATFFCTVVPAFAYTAIGGSGVEVSSFWTWLSGIRDLDPTMQNVPRFFESFAIENGNGEYPGCPSGGNHDFVGNSDPTNLITDSRDLRCTKCGLLYSLYCGQKYSDTVSTLPANGIDSAGGLYWYPTDADIASFTFSYWERHNENINGSWVFNNSYEVTEPGTFVHSNTYSVSVNNGVYAVATPHPSRTVLIGGASGSTVDDSSSTSNVASITVNYNVKTAGVYKRLVSKGLVTECNEADGYGTYSDNWTEENKGYIQGSTISETISGSALKDRNSYWYIDKYIASWKYFHPVYSISGLNYNQNIYNINTRVGTFSGNYVYTGDNGTQIVAENVTIVNEGDKTIYNPVTNTTYNYDTYNYDYSTRTYDINTTDNKKVVVNFADNALNISVDGTDYVVSYTTQHEHSYELVDDIAPTCTEQGIIRRRCSCGDEHITYLDPLGHDWICTGYVAQSGEYSTNTDISSPSDLATNSDISPGYYVFTCTRCGAVNREYITGHPSESPIYTEGIFSILNRIVSLLESVDSKLFGALPAYPVSNDGYLLRMIYNAIYGGNSSGSDIVTTAVSQIGQTEGATYYQWYGFDSHVEWCACFVSWVANECGVLDTLIPKFAVVDDAVTWYQNKDEWLPGGSIPMPGDIIFFDWNNDHDPDHVGIVSSVQDNTVYTVEGNTGDSPGVVGTRETFISSSIIFGYGTPDYVAGGPTIYSVLVDISRKLDNLENALSRDDSETIDDINDYDFTDNPDFSDIYNVDDDNTLIDVTKTGTSIFGKLLKFLYQSAVSAAFDADPVGALADFYLDDASDINDVWEVDGEPYNPGGDSQPQVLTGTVIPTSDIGIDGDTYIEYYDDTDTVNVDLSLFSVLKEGCMSFTLAENNIFADYLGGGAIGGQASKQFDLSNVSTVSITLVSGSHSYNNYNTYRFAPAFLIENTFNPVSIFVDDGKIRDNMSVRIGADNQTVNYTFDVSALTGNYWLVFSSHGADSTLSNVVFNAPGILHHAYVKENGSWREMTTEELNSYLESEVSP